MIEIVPIQLSSIIAPLIVTAALTIGGYFAGRAKKFDSQHRMLLDIPNDVKALDERITSRLGSIDKKVSELAAHDLNDNDALVALLLDNITRYGTYLERKGWASPDEKAKLQQMYRPYHNRGGNGVATSIVERALALQDVKPDE